MPEFSLQLVVFLLCVGAYTVAAAVWDIRIKKIPNKLTLPVFGLGILYQGVFNGLPGLMDGGLGFLIGFGFLYLLWMIGTGGGGDVKLIGGLSIWLGFTFTWMVLLGSGFLAAIGAAVIMFYTAMTRGSSKMKDQYLATGKTAKGEKPKVETVEQRVRRRPMGYAVPVALATWMIVLFNLTKFPFVGQ